MAALLLRPAASRCREGGRQRLFRRDQLRTRLHVPSWFSFGYNDEVVPPNSAYATYNVTAGPRELHVYPATGHFWFQEQWDEWQAWIARKLGLAEK